MKKIFFLYFFCISIINANGTEHKGWITLGVGSSTCGRYLDLIENDEEGINKIVFNQYIYGVAKVSILKPTF